MTENRYAVLWGLFVLQALCTVFFVSDALSDLRDPVEDVDDGLDILEYVVSFALAVSTVFTGMELRRASARERRMSRQIQVASGAFATVLERHFTTWGLTAAEREVALLAIKGFFVAETAKLRDASEGTVKAQNAAIYRKAGVGGRLQILSLFLEDLMSERLIDPARRRPDPGIEPPP